MKFITKSSNTKYFRASNNQYVTLFPIRNIVNKGNDIYEVWDIDFNSKIYVDPIHHDKITYSNNLYYYDVKKNKTKLISVVDYDCNRKVIFSHEYSQNETEWQRIIPDSIQEAKMEYLKTLVNRKKR